MNVSLDSFGLMITPIISCDITTFQSPVLDHGYTDLQNFPSWQEFNNRSIGLVGGYRDYIAYVVFKNNDFTSPIGVVAIQLTSYEELKDKVPIIVPEYEHYLYLSWIAIEKNQQDKKYFEILFYFYKSIVKQLSSSLSAKIGGAAILIRRMRSLFVNIMNMPYRCPETTEKEFIVNTQKVRMTFLPSELLSEPPIVHQDYVMINFFTIDKSIKE